jgi:Methyltransferase domain
MVSERDARWRRAAHVLGLWLRYAGDHPHPGQALADFRDWITTTFLGRDLLTAELPWITFPALRWLRAYLRPSMSVFEWGSGASTIFLARRVGRVVSIEYDAGWCEAVATRLRAHGLGNAELRHLPPEPGDDDALYRSSAAEFVGLSFRRYVQSVLEHPDRAFDVILVDGRARLGCVVTALPKLRDDGVLILDDSEREDATEACTLLAARGWTARHFTGPGPHSVWPVFTRTTAFFRVPPEKA